jgi:hypothetical protein
VHDNDALAAVGAVMEPAAWTALTDGCTCDELHAVTTAYQVAAGHGFVSQTASPKEAAATLVRCEARIAVKKCRDKGLTPFQLEAVAIEAVLDLIARSIRQQNKKDQPMSTSNNQLPTGAAATTGVCARER